MSNNSPFDWTVGAVLAAKDLDKQLAGEKPVDRKVHWAGEPPTECQLSGRKITTSFVDGRVPGHGSWAFMHPAYFKEYGGTFGTGRGQRYEKQENGRWLKVEG